MNIHIGNLIRKKLEDTGMSKSELSRRINKSRQNVNHILSRKSIDTDLLLRISGALRFDFFHLFSEESLPSWNEGIAFYRKRKTTSPVKKADAPDIIKDLELARKEIAYLKRINELLEKKEKK